jgi:hypothetical protein
MIEENKHLYIAFCNLSEGVSDTVQVLKKFMRGKGEFKEYSK